MCGRVAVTTLKGEIAEVFAFWNYQVEHHYNVAPTGLIPTITAGPSISMRKWGLIPSWAKDGVIAAKTFNARAETVAEKPAFRAAFKARRCLIPVAGIYEWAQVDKGKVPFFISNADPAEMLVFAGLWERWGDLETCTVITTEANSFMQELHTRMPVVLPREAWNTWLSPGAAPGELQGLLKPCPSEWLQAWQVQPLRGDGPELCERVS